MGNNNSCRPPGKIQASPLRSVDRAAPTPSTLRQNIDAAVIALWRACSAAGESSCFTEADGDIFLQVSNHPAIQDRLDEACAACGVDRR